MKKIFIFSLFTLCLLSFLFLNMNGAVAAVSLPNFLKGGTGTTAVTTIIQNTITAILGVVGAIALLMFVYGGFMIILSAGSPEKVTKGKNILIWAVIGLFAILGSYMILDFIIKNVTGTASTGGPPVSATPPQSTPATVTCKSKGGICTLTISTTNGCPAGKVWPTGWSGHCGDADFQAENRTPTAAEKLDSHCCKL